MGKKSPDKKEGGSAAPFHNPFGALSGLRDELPSSGADGMAPDVSPSKAATGPARAVVRIERKGRGGKEVTVVEHLDLPPAELDVWLRALKNALGCGGTREESNLVLQGDQRERIEAVLLKRGVRRVTIA